MVSHDGVWRAVYDKVPPPPPHHFRGKDKITIHEDTDGDGVFDRHKTFVDGLNIATAVAHGRGGVWVLNPPYLLFYPDATTTTCPMATPKSISKASAWKTRTRSSTACAGAPTAGSTRPRGRPSPATSLARARCRQGAASTRWASSSGDITPRRSRYEVFAEGGGNAFGVEIDAKGRIYSGHNGGDTRGFHYVQGGILPEGVQQARAAVEPLCLRLLPGDEAQSGSAVHAYVCHLRSRCASAVRIAACSSASRRC